MQHATIAPDRPSTREQLLTLLKKSEGLTADQLARLLGITSMAVRKHLAALERDGLVTTSLLRRKVGRPARLYRLSEQADPLFPQQYDAMLTEVLYDLADLDGPAKVELLLRRRAERAGAVLARELDGTPTLRDRVRRLAETLDALGYYTTWEELDGESFRLCQYHCPIRQVAARFPVTCEAEVELYRRLLRADVERRCRLVAGDPCCCYVIRPLDGTPTSVQRAS
ncbi:MAG: metalloregulator ArsR/SmtB family transcription factor [Thermomicrobium sp.]|nr:transcriptional regulator [Thermomicrobium sp.]MDW8058759.1 metalloregulator ArsR/SmtB family transcription factor [Thermomicrobium sp.]